MYLADTCSSGSRPAPRFWGLAGVNVTGLLPRLGLFWGLIVWLSVGMSVECLCVSLGVYDCGPLSAPTYAQSEMLLNDLLCVSVCLKL